jgi:uncharacterized membrane protein YdjX (TVP38/TMEM64 family)
MRHNVEENYFSVVMTFMVVSTTLVALTLPITGPIGIAGGFIFGLLPGLFYGMLSILAGTTISFLVIRHALSHIVKERYRDKLDEFSDRVHKYGYSYLISLQLLTVVPFFVINTLAALAGVSLQKFLLTTMLGSLPIMIIYTFAGRELYMIQSWRDIISVHMLALLVLLAAIAMMPMIVRKIKAAGWFSKDPEDDDENISPWINP